MALTKRTIPSLLNGISRQPDILRSQDQTADEVNTWGFYSEGLGRRPPTELVAEVPVADVSNAFVHEINRDPTERYMVVIADGGVRVFDLLTGAEQVVNTPFGTAYLNGPARAFKATTVADYTFIVNSSVKTKLADVAADEVTPSPGLYIPGGWGARGTQATLEAY